MLSRAHINKAVNDAIKTIFPTVPIQSSDIEEGFPRPSFYVSIETNSTQQYQFSIMRDMTCRIKYFPKDRNLNKEEVYDVQDKLEMQFGLTLPVGDRVFTIDGAATEVVDKVLHFSFDFSYYESKDQAPEGPLMEELEFNG
ncbi:phage tail terminator family protein [Paenibacillus gansuensis]|uniref:DUF6838 family protein n=1 Tax=Paenibacillus gansuensis TaxID=306542 RepID=A0ABW5PIY4_9BACL